MGQQFLAQRRGTGSTERDSLLRLPRRALLCGVGGGIVVVVRIERCGFERLLTMRDRRRDLTVDGALRRGRRSGVDVACDALGAHTVGVYKADQQCGQPEKMQQGSPWACPLRSAGRPVRNHAVILAPPATQH